MILKLKRTLYNIYLVQLNNQEQLHQVQKALERVKGDSGSPSHPYAVYDLLLILPSDQTRLLTRKLI
jgi:hypothetical protein